MVRRNSPVDMGLWMKLDPKCLIIPLDTHVHRIAVKWWFTSRKHADMKAAVEITQFLNLCFQTIQLRETFCCSGTVLSIRTRGNLNNKFNGDLTHLVA